MRRERKRRPTLPGDVLAELYLKPHSISIARFAEAAGVSRKHMSAVINGRASVTAETATRIATALGTSAQYWLNLQNGVDLYDASARVKDAAKRPKRMPVFERIAEEAA
jgi:antitoxin HigA-1